MKFEEAFKDYNEDIKSFNRGMFDELVGQKIVACEYGLDADGDPELYYIILENGVKIGIARVYPDGEVIELDRTEKYADKSIIRFQFHNWPKEHLYNKEND